MTRPIPLPVARVDRPRAYPMPRRAADPRFTWGLTHEVRDVLVRHGFPAEFSGMDLVELQQALFTFLYAPSTPVVNEVVDLVACAICGTPVRYDPLKRGWTDAAGRFGWGVDDVKGTDQLIHFHRVKSPALPVARPGTTGEPGARR